MQDDIDSAERRGGTSNLINSMMLERNQLLNLLVQTSTKDSNGEDVFDRESLDEFCQVMVDYIAAGHFGLYERIVEGTERRRGVADLAVELYPHIEKTTQAALAFNEKYDAARENTNASQLHQDLSELGEHLTNRIEYVDQIIQKLSEPK